MGASVLVGGGGFEKNRKMGGGGLPTMGNPIYDGNFGV